ncbi:hypothetical protein GQ43DRAFT_467251 [Delitschia confertaspora ATCC 74209]|uniref:Uncharacterized protein n=1 Tax=Delitschia confertaspora ATCC 74209 TaxID=1513339 RepID=A0A9P4JFL9_9PLEO|nr:hypothetical protein GQ43DRAFT_467251 [Delitschia confertaspora ATCC 74209]
MSKPTATASVVVLDDGTQTITTAVSALRPLGRVALAPSVAVFKKRLISNDAEGQRPLKRQVLEDHLHSVRTLTTTIGGKSLYRDNGPFKRPCTASKNLVQDENESRSVPSRTAINISTTAGKNARKNAPRDRSRASRERELHSFQIDIGPSLQVDISTRKINHRGRPKRNARLPVRYGNEVTKQQRQQISVTAAKPTLAPARYGSEISEQEEKQQKRAAAVTKSTRHCGPAYVAPSLSTVNETLDEEEEDIFPEAAEAVHQEEEVFHKEEVSVNEVGDAFHQKAAVFKKEDFIHKTEEASHKETPVRQATAALREALEILQKASEALKERQEFGEVERQQQQRPVAAAKRTRRRGRGYTDQRLVTLRYSLSKVEEKLKEAEKIIQKKEREAAEAGEEEDNGDGEEASDDKEDREAVEGQEDQDALYEVDPIAAEQEETIYDSEDDYLIATPEPPNFIHPKITINLPNLSTRVPTLGRIYIKSSDAAIRVKFPNASRTDMYFPYLLHALALVYAFKPGKTVSLPVFDEQGNVIVEEVELEDKALERLSEEELARCTFEIVSKAVTHADLESKLVNKKWNFGTLEVTDASLNMQHWSLWYKWIRNRSEEKYAGFQRPAVNTAPGSTHGLDQEDLREKFRVWAECYVYFAVKYQLWDFANYCMDSMRRLSLHLAGTNMDIIPHDLLRKMYGDTKRAGGDRDAFRAFMAYAYVEAFWPEAVPKHIQETLCGGAAEGEREFEKMSELFYQDKLERMNAGVKCWDEEEFGYRTWRDFHIDGQEDGGFKLRVARRIFDTEGKEITETEEPRGVGRDAEMGTVGEDEAG